MRGLWDRLGAGNAFSEDERLCAGGVPVKIEDTPGILHHKFLAIDAAGAAPKVVTGSLNWTAAANDANSENTVIVHDGALAQAYAGRFRVCGAGWSRWKRATRRWPRRRATCRWWCKAGWR